MIVKPNETTVAYRCPECGSGVKSIVGIFSLSADMLKLKCPCGGSSMTIKRTNDDKIRISVPCMVCRRDHEFVISKELFFKNELFINPLLIPFSLCTSLLLMLQKEKHRRFRQCFPAIGVRKKRGLKEDFRKRQGG